nr:hypothetical protein [uncultured Acetatifactor sp.]
MKPSNFQFINPYLEELYFSSNPDFHPDTDIGEVEIQNAFEVHIERKQDENKMKTDRMSNWYWQLIRKMKKLRLSSG